MKKILLTLIGLFLIFPAAAQIIVTSDDVVGAGAIVVLGIDTTSMLTAGNGGTGQVWDFTSLATQAYDTMWFMNPAQTPYPDAYPAANIAVRIWLENAYYYLQNNAQEMASLGGVMEIEELGGLTVLSAITPKEVIAAFPMNYLDNYTESFVQEIRAPNPDTSLGVDSIWIKMYTTKTTIVDAWGTVTIPLGSYEALRVRENKTMVDSIFGFMFGSWMLLDIDGDIDEVYSWWTDAPNIGYPAVELNVDTETGFADDIFFLTQEPVYGIGEPAMAGIVMAIFPNPALDHLTIRYRMPDAGYRMIDLYSIEGRKIRELVNESMPAGTHEMEMDVSDLPAGVYFVRVQADNAVQTRKLVIVD